MVHVNPVLRHLRENKDAMLIVKGIGGAAVRDAVGFGDNRIP